MKIIQIPAQFQPRNRVKYPPHNDMVLEEFVFDAIKNIDVKTRLAYLPIFWTTYYCRHQYSSQAYIQASQQIKDFCKTIREPWFTISQYDDGIMFDHEDMPVEFISMNAGGVGDIALPLTSFSWPNSDIRPPQKYVASFMGCVVTNPIRKKMFDILQEMEGFYLENITYHKGYYKDIMLQSRYALCPRGVGRTSFRLYEAIQMKTIPIYISDKFWCPFEDILNWEEFCIKIDPDKIKNIPDILNKIPEKKIEAMSKKCDQAWHEYFSYQGCTKQIIRLLEKV